jgi:hypothetical protein
MILAITLASMLLGILASGYVWAEWPLIYTPPKPGEVWQFKGWRNDDPWTKDRHTVTVLDVRDGWVRYSMGSVFNDNRSKMKVFLFCYGRPRSEEVRQGEQG